LTAKERQLLQDWWDSGQTDPALEQPVRALLARSRGAQEYLVALDALDEGLREMWGSCHEGAAVGREAVTRIHRRLDERRDGFNLYRFGWIVTGAAAAACLFLVWIFRPGVDEVFTDVRDYVSLSEEQRMPETEPIRVPELPTDQPPSSNVRSRAAGDKMDYAFEADTLDRLKIVPDSESSQSAGRRLQTFSESAYEKNRENADGQLSWWEGEDSKRGLDLSIAAEPSAGAGLGFGGMAAARQDSEGAAGADQPGRESTLNTEATNRYSISDLYVGNTVRRIEDQDRRHMSLESIGRAPVMVVRYRDDAQKRLLENLLKGLATEETLTQLGDQAWSLEGARRFAPLPKRVENGSAPAGPEMLGTLDAPSPTLGTAEAAEPAAPEWSDWREVQLVSSGPFYIRQSADGMYQVRAQPDQIRTLRSALEASSAEIARLGQQLATPGLAGGLFSDESLRKAEKPGEAPHAVESSEEDGMAGLQELWIRLEPLDRGAEGAE
jgi:hypothetical protein